MLGLTAPRRMTRATSVAESFSTSPICFNPRLRKTTPTASSTSAISSTNKTLVMSQILVTNQPHVVLLNQRSNPRADQGLEFTLKFIERRVGVKLRITGRQLRDEPGDVLPIHARVLQQAEDGGRVFDAALPQNGARSRRKQPENQRVAGAIKEFPRRQPPVQPETIGGQPEMRDTPVASASHQNSKNHRVQMKVEMAIDVVEREARHAEPFKLRLDFALQLRSQFRPKKVANAARHGVV